jgi:ribosomal protein S18 acetylase RimI-like enzyme
MSQLVMTRPIDEAGVTPKAAAAVRTAGADEAEPLARLMARAFPEMPWDADRVRRDLLDAADVETTFVVAAGGEIVATASARNSSGFPGLGYVHWVAVDPARRGSGLFEAVMDAVLARFAAQQKPAVLETDDQRLPAIAAYLRIGFVPTYREHDHPLRWSRIFAQLGQQRRKEPAR